jgi:membrane protein
VSQNDARTSGGAADDTVQRGEDAHRFRAHEEKMPDGPTDLGKPGWMGVLKRTVSEFLADKCTDLAAALTYYAVLSLFPALIAVTSLLPLFGGGPETTQQLVQIFRDLGAAEDALSTIEEYLDSMQAVSGAGLGLVIGLLVALWAASNYVNAFSRAMNTIYEVEEGRPLWKLRPIMLGLTVVLVVLVLLVIVALVLSGGLAHSVGSLIGLGDTAVTVWNIAKWPVVVLIVIVIIALLYWGTPNVKQSKFRWISPGAVVAILVAALGTVAFGFYVANFGNYNATYGALAGVVIGLLWMWLINVALLFGAEFDAELERGRELQAGLPAEETIQLPPRDTTQSDKKAEKQADLVAEARRLRLRANREG